MNAIEILSKINTEIGNIEDVVNNDETIDCETMSDVLSFCENAKYFVESLETEVVSLSAQSGIPSKEIVDLYCSQLFNEIMLPSTTEKRQKEIVLEVDKYMTILIQTDGEIAEYLYNEWFNKILDNLRFKTVKQILNSSDYSSNVYGHFET